MGENMEKEQWMKESLQMQKASWIQDEITKRREREDELLQQILWNRKCCRNWTKTWTKIWHMPEKAANTGRT